MAKKLAGWLILAVILYFPFFLHLDFYTLKLYDEARRACNAFEMTQNGNLLVTYFDGQPEMWGTKPPLLIWLQAGLMKLIGYNELAVRLPAALAGLSLVLYLFHFGKRHLGSIAIGLFSLLVLITTNGFIDSHVTRTGDFDALLCLWTTLYLLTFFRYTEATEPAERNRLLYYTALFVLLAAWTKGIAGFFFAPGMLLFALVKKQLVPLLKNKHAWFSAALVLGGVALFYLLREHYNPGYMAKVWENEVGGRYQKALEGNSKPPGFYLSYMARVDFSIWLGVLPLGILAGFSGSAKTRSLTLLLVINAIIFLGVISMAGTKLVWYMAPVFPSFAILCAIGLAYFYRMLFQKLPDFWQQRKHLVLAAFSTLVFAWPYGFIVNKVYEPDFQRPSNSGYSQFMRFRPEMDNYRLAHPLDNAHTLFYLKVVQHEGKNIKTFSPKNQQKQGQNYLLCTSKDYNYFTKRHHINVIEEWRSCKLVEITGYKDFQE